MRIASREFSMCVTRLIDQHLPEWIYFCIRYISQMVQDKLYQNVHYIKNITNNFIPLFIISHRSNAAIWCDTMFSSNEAYISFV
ncbi:hypothetical protein KM043_002438 [Ampulex compressa]|nr:hypothetical protein KM043_002438 [Ampulex compressa]